MLCRGSDHPNFLRLCLVTLEYPPITSYSGGIGTQFSTLAPALAALGHEIHVITTAETGPRTGERNGVRLQMPRRAELGRLWPLADTRWTFTVERALRRLGRFDVVFAPEWRGEAARYARRKRSGPLVTALQTSLAQILDISPEMETWRSLRIQHAIQKRLERVQAERSDGLVAPSHSVLDWARKLWRLEGIESVVIPNAVDADRIRALARGELPDGYPKQRPVVAFAGRLELRKGVDVLVEAMHSVWQELPQARLVLMGHDMHAGMQSRLRTLAGDRVDRLHLLGNQPPERLFPALAAADVVALPSRWENLALAALEAMALGKPVILGDCGGFAELVEDGVNGLLVAPAQTAPLGHALVRLLDDPGFRTRLGSGAAKRAEDYSAKVIAERHVAFFERIATTV